MNTTMSTHVSASFPAIDDYDHLEAEESQDEGEGGNHDDESDEDYSDDGGDEGEEGYRLGGYHPVNVGEKYHARYTVIEKLGWGHFSTVWMVHDKKAALGTKTTGNNPTPDYVALKIQKSAPHYREAAVDEIELLNCASKCARSEAVLKEFGPNYDPAVVLLLDHFEHTGPNGQHMCMVFEMLGENLLEVIKKYDYKGIPVPIVRAFAKQICVGLDFLHRHCNIIHTDLKPENLLIARPAALPSQEVISNLLAAGGNASAAAKKKAKKNKKTSAGSGAADIVDANNTIDAIAKQLADKSLNAEQRKKLRKKLKKKKQMAKKKDKKGGGSKKERNRRSDRPGIVGEGASSLSVEKAELEARMMERDANRISASDADLRVYTAADIKQGGGRGDVLDDLDAHADAKDLFCAPHGVRLQAKGELTKSDTGTGAKGEDNPDDISLQHLSLEDKHSHNANTPDMFPDPPLDVALPHPDDLSSDEIHALMPPWLRPTWFAFLNFSGEEYDESMSAAGNNDADFSRVRRITSTQWVNPSESASCKLTLFLSINRMIDAFGNPDDFDNMFEGDLPFADFYFALESFRGDNGESGEDEDDDDLQRREGSSDGSKQFLIRGCGFDAACVTSMVGTTALNSLAYESEKYYIASPDEEGDQPVEWSIVHHADSTRAIIAYLERAIDGVSFLVHFNAPDAIADEDDKELLCVMQKKMTLPAGENGGDETDSVRALVGIDVLSLSRSIRCATEDPELPESERKSYDFTGYVHPLDKRYAYYCSYKENVAWALSTYHQVLLALDANYERQSQPDEEIEDKYRERLHALQEQYENVQVKVVDLGNACWTHKHFTDDIQTRQYRCPEVLLGASYDTSADMWSFACVIFELLTGDLLFDPRAGTKWDREEDHLAMMMELCGDFPRKITSVGKRAHQYFNKRGELHNISHLKYWPLKDVLHDKYRMSRSDADMIASFIMPCLSVDPAERATALQCLSHPFLNDEHTHTQTTHPDL